VGAHADGGQVLIVIIQTVVDAWRNWRRANVQDSPKGRAKWWTQASVNSSQCAPIDEQRWYELVAIFADAVRLTVVVLIASSVKVYTPTVFKEQFTFLNLTVSSCTTETHFGRYILPVKHRCFLGWDLLLLIMKIVLCVPG
jgi:hypothetical protein